MTYDPKLTDTYFRITAEDTDYRTGGTVPDKDFIDKHTHAHRQKQMTLQIRKCTLGGIDEAARKKLHYTLGDCIGQGAYGIIHRAIQNSVDREIALKIIRPELSGDSGIQSLLLSEAIVIGDLDHPNIVPVYDLGMDHEGHFFYTMKRIKGISWDHVLHEKTEAENLEIFLRVCDAIAFAHDKGVIHRDLKPQNVMIGKYGEVFVMDWGIAASPTGEGKAEKLTDQTNRAGTPVYMAPEMVDPEVGSVNHLSDIYLLGGILYQIKTGLTPHTGSNLDDCIKRVIRNEIQPTTVKSELIDLALKAMQTDPCKRYQSVAELQQAIRGYQSRLESVGLMKNAADYHQKALTSKIYDDYLTALFSYKNALNLWSDNREALEAVRHVKLDYATCAFEKADFDLALTLLDARDALHQGLLEKVRRERRERDAHQKKIARLKRGSILLGGVIILILAVAFFIIKAERDRALVAEKEMHNAQLNERMHRKQAEKENYTNTIALVARKINDHLFEQAQQKLMHLPPELRGWEWGRLKRQCALALVTFESPIQPLEAVAFAPDGKTIATAGKNSEIAIWDVRNGKPLKTINDYYGNIRNLEFTPDGQMIYALNSDGLKFSWDLKSGRMIEVAHSQQDDELFVFYSADHRYFIKRTLENTVQIQRVKQNRSVVVLKGHDGPIYTAAFSPDNKKVATGSADKTAIIWDSKTGRQLNRLVGHTGTIQSIKFSPDGKYVLTGSTDKTAQLWSVDKNRDHQILSGHKRFVTCVAFSPDSKYLASAGEDKTIRIWNIGAHRVERLLLGHENAVHTVRFSRDGRFLISGGADNLAFIWDLTNGKKVGTLKGHSHSIMAADFSPDGKYAATGSWDRTLKIWDLSTRTVVMTLTGHSDAVIALAFAPDGKTLCSGGKDKTAIIWDLATGKKQRTLKGHTESIYSVAYAPDGRTIATASWDKTIKIWDSAEGRLWQTLKGHANSVYSAVFSPDGRRIISAGWDKTIRVWDISSGYELIQLTGHSAPINSVAIASDGKLVASGSRDRTVIIWEADPY